MLLVHPCVELHLLLHLHLLLLLHLSHHLLLLLLVWHRKILRHARHQLLRLLRHLGLLLRKLVLKSVHFFLEFGLFKFGGNVINCLLFQRFTLSLVLLLQKQILRISQIIHCPFFIKLGAELLVVIGIHHVIALIRSIHNHGGLKCTLQYSICRGPNTTLAAYIVIV